MIDIRGRHHGSRLRFIGARLLRLGIGFFAATLCYSAVVNKMMEVTVRGQIDEQLQAVMMGSGLTDPEERTALRDRTRAALERSFGLDKPAWVRVARRSWDIVTLDLGDARYESTGYPKRSSKVSDIILDRLPPTLIMFSLTTVISIALGLWIGRWMAARPGGRLDRAATSITMVMFGTPTWWVASFMVLLFVYVVPVFRVGALHSPNLPDDALIRFLDYLSYLALPVLSLVLVKTWGIAFYTRAMTVVPMQEDYVMAARGRGLPEGKILRKHALRVAAPGITTMAAQAFAQSICGDILVEQVMARPGIGWTLFAALRWNDIPLITGILSVITMIYVLTFAVMDILYAFLDPRIGYGSGNPG